MQEQAPKRVDSAKKRPWWWPLIYAAIALLIVYAVQTLWANGTAPEQAPYSGFLAAVEADDVARAEVSENEIEWQRRSSQDWFKSTRIPGDDPSDVIVLMRDHGVEFEGRTTSTFWVMVLSWVVPVALIAVVWFFLISRMGGRQQALKFGRSGARVFDSGSVNVNFGNVAALEEAKAELQEVVDMLRNPERYRAIGARIPKGVILMGPPGTGKTLMARATAGEAGVPFFSMSGSEFVELFVGIGAARVRDLFDQAKKSAPCIVFIDEIETIGRHRGRSVVGAHEEREQTLNQLLTEMDGFDPTVGIIVMAATNRPDLIDTALLRPGRFDRRIFVERPDMAGREAILELHARRVALAPDVDLRTIAARTPGFAGAELANVVNEAALLAARAGRSNVGMEYLNEAVDRVMTGLEQRSRTLSEEEKERVAFHEMGHALSALLLPHTDPVHKVSIIPRGRAALGMTLQMPLQDRYVFTRDELEDRIAVELGGRAAEQIIFGDFSTGAADDLQKATSLAVRMVREFGMSASLGAVAYPAAQDDTPGDVLLGEKPYSDETARQMDVEVKSILDHNYERTLALLEAREPDLRRLAKELQTRETMSGDELRERMAADAHGARTREPVASGR